MKKYLIKFYKPFWKNNLSKISPGFWTKNIHKDQKKSKYIFDFSDENVNHFGDQLVRINIETPKKISNKAKTLMDELSKELEQDVSFEKFN